MLEWNGQLTGFEGNGDLEGFPAVRAAGGGKELCADHFHVGVGIVAADDPQGAVHRTRIMDLQDVAVGARTVYVVDPRPGSRSGIGGEG